jgi:hypothetical protein
MSLYSKYREGIAELLYCDISENSAQECLEIYNKLVEEGFNNPEIVSLDENGVLNIDRSKALSFLCAQEALDIPSKEIESKVKTLFQRYKSGVSIEEIAQIEDPDYSNMIFVFLDVIKRESQIKEMVKPKYKHQYHDPIIKRDSVEYMRVENSKSYEIQKLFAFELNKRLYPYLYLVQYEYNRDIAQRFSNAIKPMKIYSCLNSSNKINYSDKSNIFTKKLMNYLENIESESCFSLLERHFELMPSLNWSDEALSHKKYYLSSDSVILRRNLENVFKVMPMFTTPPVEGSRRWEVDVRLDLSLPDDQIMEYVKEIKREIELNFGNSGHDDELLEKNSITLTRFNIEGMRKHDKNIPKSKRILTSQQMIADLLFVFDSLVDQVNPEMITEELENYYLGDKDQNKRKDLKKRVQAYKTLLEELLTNMSYEHIV